MNTPPSKQMIYVAGSAIELLRDFLDSRSDASTVPAGLRARLARLAEQPHMPVETWWALLADIADMFPEPGLGLSIGTGLRPHHVGVLGYVLLYCDTAAQALWRFSRLEPLLHNLSPSEVLCDGDDLVIRWRPLPSTLLSDEVVLSGFLAMARRLIQHDAPLNIQVGFRHPAPVDTTPHTRYFGVPPLWGCPNQFVRLPVAYLNAPVSHRDPHLVKLLERQADALMASLPRDDALLRTLKMHMMAVLQDGAPDVGTMASRMGMSERSLYRQLKERDVRYSAVLSALRYSLAKDYLTNSRLTLPEIAQLLGFAEQSTFSRAFRIWSGVSPGQYRQQTRI